MMSIVIVIVGVCNILYVKLLMVDEAFYCR